MQNVLITQLQIIVPPIDTYEQCTSLDSHYSHRKQGKSFHNMWPNSLQHISLKIQNVSFFLFLKLAIRIHWFSRQECHMVGKKMCYQNNALWAKSFDWKIMSTSTLATGVHSYKITHNCLHSLSQSLVTKELHFQRKLNRPSLFYESILRDQNIYAFGNVRMLLHLTFWPGLLFNENQIF